MNHGSCLCGEIAFSVKGNALKVSHCHCTMCQKQHGAAFATYARFLRSDITYLKGEKLLTCYDSSAGVKRKFCAKCGSNIEWTMPNYSPESVAKALTLLDNQMLASTIKVLHRQSSAPWLDTPCIIEDD